MNAVLMSARSSNCVDTELAKKVEQICDELTRKVNTCRTHAELVKTHGESSIDARFGDPSIRQYIDARLAKKADRVYVEVELAKRAVKGHVDAELSMKANDSYVRAELAKKANRDHVDSELT